MNARLKVKVNKYNIPPPNKWVTRKYFICKSAHMVAISNHRVNLIVPVEVFRQKVSSVILTKVQLLLLVGKDLHLIKICQFWNLLALVEAFRKSIHVANSNLIFPKSCWVCFFGRILHPFPLYCLYQDSTALLSQNRVLQNPIINNRCLNINI